MLIVVAVAAADESAWAGKFNPKLSPGDAAPAWSKLPGVDGQNHSLQDYDFVAAAGRRVHLQPLPCGPGV